MDDKAPGRPAAHRSRLPIVESLRDLPDAGGRYLADSAGEMARVINGQEVRYAAFIEFKAGGRPRGNHVHRAKIEYFYLFAGQLRGTFIDEHTLQRETITIEAGDLVTIMPGCAHVYETLDVDSYAFEFANLRYDPADTTKFQITE